MDRRAFLAAGLGTGLACGLRGWRREQSVQQVPNANGIVPVVGDGEWIWTEPPSDQQGYLDPREYDLKVGMQFRGTGFASQLNASTVVPLELDEQRIDRVEIDTSGCTAMIRQLAPAAAQLVLRAPAIEAGQVIAAAVRYRLRISKDYRAFSKEQFPVNQEVPKELRKIYLFDSPGIQTRHDLVRATSRKVVGQIQHPWDQAKAIHAWVWENIEGRPQDYTNVVTALRERIGDCEERAATFVALCRVAGIPARLVWVPNHNWAEFYLTDEAGVGHWIPAHTSGYSWFGWTGAHELVLQKGDRINVPEKRRPQRLLADWVRWTGAKLQGRFFGELSPAVDDSATLVGPGTRQKDGRGAWNVVERHPLDPYMRDGRLADKKPPASS